MGTQTSLKTALQNVQVDPVLERFIGCIALGRVPDDVAKAMDEMQLR